MEGEQASAARQVEGNQPRAKHPDWPGIRLLAASRLGIDQISAGSPAGLPLASRQTGLNVGIGDAETEILQQPGLLQIDADLQIVRGRTIRERSLLTPQFSSCRAWLCVAGESANGSRLA